MSDVSLASESGSIVEAFARDGFVGPFDLLTPAQCALVRRHWRRGPRRPAPIWPKGRAVSDRVFYHLATQPALLSLLRQVLGDHIVLWGASVIEREPGQVHPWHTDIESCAAAGFASVWIGIQNTSQESALQLIGRSHAFGKSIQQVVYEAGLKRGQASDEAVLEWARAIDPDAAFVQPDMTDGQAILFDGRIWHATNNTRSSGRRAALLLQYAAADRPVRIPDLNQLEWPFRLRDDARPPCIVVSGTADPQVNRLAPAPPLAPGDPPPLSSQIRPVALPLAEDPEGRWRPYPLLRGPTPLLESMSCHVSVLSPGHSPHPPHAHLDEELLIVLDGEAEILITDGRQADGARIETMAPGSFVYYPTYQYHTIRNASARPITYLMLKWYSRAEPTRPLFKPRIEPVVAAEDAGARPFAAKRLFEFPTSFLTKLHCHRTVLQPGAGYEPHVDEYDVAILVLSGRVETLGRTVEPFGIIYYPAGEPHGMKNVGTDPARYLVFEFHAPRREPQGVPAEQPSLKASG